MLRLSLSYSLKVVESANHPETICALDDILREHIVNMHVNEPKKVLVIANYPFPKTIKDLRAFLSIAGYYKLLQTFRLYCKAT